MSKNLHYGLVLGMMFLFSGCSGTIHGFCDDVHNLPNPDRNGWNAIKRVDAWMQENMW